MADISITAGNVKVTDQSATLVKPIRYGATVLGGQPLIRNSDNSYSPADSDTGGASAAAAVCIALTPGAIGEDGYGVFSGPMVVGGTLTAGTEYYVSNNAGGICPRTDLGTADYVTRLGIASTTSILLVNIHASGVQVP